MLSSLKTCQGTTGMRAIGTLQEGGAIAIFTPKSPTLQTSLSSPGPAGLSSRHRTKGPSSYRQLSEDCPGASGASALAGRDGQSQARSLRASQNPQEVAPAHTACRGPRGPLRATGFCHFSPQTAWGRRPWRAAPAPAPVRWAPRSAALPPPTLTAGHSSAWAGTWQWRKGPTVAPTPPWRQLWEQGAAACPERASVNPSAEPRPGWTVPLSPVLGGGLGSSHSSSTQWPGEAVFCLRTHKTRYANTRHAGQARPIRGLNPTHGPLAENGVETAQAAST